MNEAVAKPSRARIRWAIIGFVVGLTMIILISIIALSLDRRLVGRVNPVTDNAYVGGDVTPLSARVTGYLRRLPITDNQFVHAGQVIAEIETDDYRDRVTEAEAGVAAAQAKLESLDAEGRQLAAQTGESETGVAAATAETTRASPELRRQLLLQHTDIGLERNLEEARAADRLSQANIDAAQAMVLVRQRQAEVLAAQRREAAAALDARQADLALARISLGWTTLAAPADGTLGVRLVREGDLLTTGTEVVTLTPLDTVWVDANFTEQQITDIRVGQQARLVLDAFPDQTLDGHVIGLSPTTGGALTAIPPDNTTGNFTKVVQRVPVRIAIDWHESSLRGLPRPGMSATVTVLTDRGGVAP